MVLKERSFCLVQNQWSSQFPGARFKGLLPLKTPQVLASKTAALHLSNLYFNTSVKMQATLLSQVSDLPRNLKVSLVGGKKFQVKMIASSSLYLYVLLAFKSHLPALQKWERKPTRFPSCQPCRIRWNPRRTKLETSLLGKSSPELSAKIPVQNIYCW